MKAIILAAGQGTRLRPLTDDVPKCMVEYRGRYIIDYILQVFKECHVDDIAIVSGYKGNVLKKYLKDERLKFYTNDKFNSTNMLYTLFCAREFMDDDIIVSYADIIYQRQILEKLIHSKENFSVIVDKKWQQLWEQRMTDPLQDAETLKIKDGNIIEIGKKPKSYKDVHGQYIGLIKISKSILAQVVDYYNGLDKNKIYDGKSFENMYMTSFIQLIADNLLDVKPVFIEGGWVEIDSVQDLDIGAIK